MNHYTFDEIEIGMTESFTTTVTKEKHEAFTSMSGDINPMHMSDEYSKENGYDNRLVYGMLTASFYSTLVGVYLPGEYCIFHEIDSKFNAPVYIGDNLTVVGKVIDKHDVFRRVKIKAHILNDKGKKVSMATLTVGVRK